MLGLISIQIYWIKNSVELRDAQFRRSVQTALAHVNRSLEHDEKIYRIRKHDFGQYLIEFDSIRTTLEKEVSTENYDILTGDPQQIPISEIADENRDADFKTMEAEYVHGKASVQKQLEKAYPFSSDQSKEIAQLIIDLSTKEIGSNFINRLNVASIDSMLRAALKEFGGIEADYHFAIFDAGNRPELVPLRSEKCQAELINEGYKFRLLPTDYLNPTTFLHIWFPQQETYLLKTLMPFLASSFLFLLAIILAFTYTIRTILRQKKVSEIKNDFINNMTHELKTPIATISLACQALNEPSMTSSDQKRKHYVDMIKDENLRLAVLVDNVLRSAVLDREQVNLNGSRVNMHAIITKAVQNLALQAENRGGKITLQLKAKADIIQGDEVHLTNLVVNLLDNAIKYSPKSPEIVVSTESTEHAITMRVTDKGMGIKKDEQKRIFEKLYRIPTGNVHDTKGFGLGLSYVKTIVVKHHGTISVTSELGKGSTFSVELPFEYEL